MSGNISVSKTKELQNLLQELFWKLQLDYKTVHKGKETISFTDATNDIINKAEENFGKIKNEKSESYLEFINTIKKDCNTNPQNPESVNFSFSEGTLRSIFNAHKKQSNRRTVGKKIAHVFALYLGYVGWDGFVNEKLIEDTHPEKGGDKSVLSESKSSYQVSIQEESKGSDDVQHKSNISTRKKTKRVVVYVLTSIVIVCLIGFLLDSYYMSQDRFSDDVNGILILPIQRDHQNSFRSDLLNTIETKIDTNLNVQVKKYESISSLFSSQYTVERAKRIGESQNARIVIWGELISGKNKLWLHITTVDSKGLEYFLEKDIKMDALDIGEFDLPSSLVETPQVILSFIRGYLSLLEKDYIKAIDYLTFVDEQKEIEEIDKMKLLNLIGASYMGLAQTNDRNFNTQKAISTYTEVINLFPLNVSGYNNLVAALLARKEYLQAIDYSKKIVQEGLISYNTWYHLGIAYYRIDSIDKAVDYFKRATIPPNEQRAISMLGSCYKRKGEYNKAIKFLNEAIKLNENDIESWYEIGRCYFFIGDSNKAKEYLEHVVENNPNHSRALVALAEIYKDDNNEAIKYLEKAFILNPSDFAINYGLGFQYSEIHKFDSAITLLKTAASIDEQRYEPWLTLGSIYLKMGKYRESNKCLLKAVSLNDGDYLSWYFLGKSYYFLEDFGHAHNSQLKALSIKQDFHLSWIENGRVFLKERKYEDVIISMNIAIDYNPNYYEAYYLKGLADLSQMRGEEALKSFSIAATLISKDEVNKLCDIWGRIGDAYLIQGDYINSEEAYNKALKFNPEFIQPLLSLGIIKTMQKDKNEAFKYFDLAENVDPEKIVVSLYRGIGYMNLSMLDDAETSFTQIVEHSGGKILGNVGLGFLSLCRGNTEEAVLFFDEASIVFDSKNEYLDYLQSITKYIEPHLLEKNWCEKISNTLKID